MTQKQYNLIDFRTQSSGFSENDRSRILNLAHDALEYGFSGNVLQPKTRMEYIDKTEFIDAIVAAEYHHHSWFVMHVEKGLEDENAEKSKVLKIVEKYGY